MVTLQPQDIPWGCNFILVLLCYSSTFQKVSNCRLMTQPLVQKAVGFHCGSAVKNPPANIGYTSLIPGLGKSPGEGNGNPNQFSCLGNPMDIRAWWATVHRVAESDRTQQINSNNSRRYRVMALGRYCCTFKRLKEKACFKKFSFMYGVTFF